MNTTKNPTQTQHGNPELNSELKSCPFCGENELLEVEAIDHGEEKRPFGCRWTAKVVCLNCFASCGTHGFQHNEENGKRMAIRAWNTRTQKGGAE